MHALWMRLRRDEGQAMVEYSLIVALISVVAIVAIGLLGGKVDDAFQYVVDNFKLPAA